MTEMILKPIPEFPNYFASADGEIYSMRPIRRNGKIPTEPRLLKKCLDGRRAGNEYYYVGLLQNGKSKKIKVAVLVLTAFVGQRPKGMYACHGVRGRLVDTLDNLYWGTPSRNNGIDKYRDGVMHCGEKHYNHTLNSLQVRIIRHLSNVDPEFRPLNGELAKYFRVSESCVEHVIHRRSWNHI